MATRWSDRGTCPQAAGGKTNARKNLIHLRAGGHSHPLTTKQDHTWWQRGCGDNELVLTLRLPAFQNEQPYRTSYKWQQRRARRLQGNLVHVLDKSLDQRTLMLSYASPALLLGSFRMSRAAKMAIYDSFLFCP